MENDLHSHAKGLTGEGFACPGRRKFQPGMQATRTKTQITGGELLGKDSHPLFPAGAKNDMIKQNCYHNNIPIDGYYLFRI
jgi:hypothetical protein